MIYAISPYARKGLFEIRPSELCAAGRKELSVALRQRADHFAFQATAFQLALNHIPVTDSPRYEQTLYETMGAELRAVEVIELCEAFE